MIVEAFVITRRDRVGMVAQGYADACIDLGIRWYDPRALWYFAGAIWWAL